MTSSSVEYPSFRCSSTASRRDFSFMSAKDRTLPWKNEMERVSNMFTVANCWNAPNCFLWLFDRLGVHTNRCPAENQNWWHLQRVGNQCLEQHSTLCRCASSPIPLAFSLPSCRVVQVLFHPMRWLCRTNYDWTVKRRDSEFLPAILNLKCTLW